jgi:hypothetical protein
MLADWPQGRRCALFVSQGENAMQHDLPPGLDPNVTRREVVVEADAETLEKMRKEGRAKIREHVYTIHCDEGANLGGDDSAPPPLAYFCTSLAF